MDIPFHEDGMQQLYVMDEKIGRLFSGHSRDAIPCAVLSKALREDGV